MFITWLVDRRAIRIKSRMKLF